MGQHLGVAARPEAMAAIDEAGTHEIAGTSSGEVLVFDLA